jgi:L-2-hydroxyglutarate oxidase LhgO
VAVDASEIPMLETLLARAQDNGARELRMLDARQTRALEPAVRAVAALASPRTGIIDAHALVESYLHDALAHNASLALASEVIAIEPRGPHDLGVTTKSASGELSHARAQHVINAAGLAASQVAALAGVAIDRLGYRQHLCKGDYFKVGSRKSGFASRLIYPVPQAAGLGVHLTLDLTGALRAGPDTEYIDAPRYDVSEGKRAAFGAALRRYLPDIRDDDLEPDYAGIRPKLQGPGEAFRDFVIDSASPHGVVGLINLLGIESPGLTASSAIARRVASQVR